MSKQLYDKNHNSFYPLTDALSVTDTRLNKNQQVINQDFESKINSLSGSTSGVTEAQVNNLISTALNKLSIVNSINNQVGVISLKSINNQSLLGSGNITITSSEGSNITLDTTVSTTSTNAVTSQGIASYVSNTLNAFHPVWNQISNKPSTFTPSNHTHPSTEITDFTAAVQQVIKNTDMACTCPLATSTQNGLLSKEDYQLLQKLREDYNKNNFTIKLFAASPTSIIKNEQTTITFMWTISDGYTIDSIELKGGSFNKTIEDTTAVSYTLETSLSQDTTFALTVKSGDKTDTAVCTIQVKSNTNKVYVGGIDKSYSSSNMTITAIQGVNSFDCAKGGTVSTTVVTTKTQKILVAYPTIYGTPTFTEGIFLADFSDWQTGSITIDSIAYTYHITDVVTYTTGSEYKLVFNN